MASERQIAANRKNSARSTGPGVEARARTRFNATKHGLAAESAAVEAGISPEFEARRALWAAEQAPADEAAKWALDKAVAASLRIDRCERVVDGLVADGRRRAELAWDEDRAAEAAAVFGKLARDPRRASRQLRTSFAGAELLAEAWLGLLAVLQSGRNWTEAEASMALDLLGVDPGLRSARTRIDPLDDSDPIAFRTELVAAEVDKLDALIAKALVPLESVDQARALAGDVALLSKPASLVLRYERDAWRRFRESMEQVKPAPGPESTLLPPAPPKLAVVERPKPLDRPAPPPKPSFEEERRALLAEASPMVESVIEELVSLGFEDEDAWIEELERRNTALTGRPGSFIPFSVGRPATERSQFAAAAG